MRISSGRKSRCEALSLYVVSREAAKFEFGMIPPKEKK